MATDSTHAKNPSLNKEGLPKEQGETRNINGQLEYLNPMTDQWVGIYACLALKKEY